MSNTYKVSCSFGEIIDKYTILKIKLNNATNPLQRNNIQKEYNILKEFIINEDTLFNELYKINQELWDLEDTIRYKIKNNLFNSSYFECSKNIHMKNDKRYLIKKKINEKYNSDIKEEKIHKINNKNINFNQITNTKQIINIDNDLSNNNIILEKAIQLFKENKFHDSYKLIKSLCSKYEFFTQINDFIINLFCSYSTCCSMIGNELSPQYIAIYKKLLNSDLSMINSDMLLHFYKTMCHILLSNKYYEDVKPYMKYLQVVTGSNNIKPSTISYLRENDKNKTVLIYNSGGIGDIIMYLRFLPEFCLKYNNNNKFVLMINDNLFWMFQDSFKEIDNLILIKTSNIDHYLNINSIDHHFNITELFCLLNKSYKEINNNNYLKYSNGSNINLNEIIDKTKLNVVINWHGNKTNVHEEHNRGLKLNLLSKIIQNNPHINWISVQKEVDISETLFLKKHNIKDLSKIIDNENKVFYDTVSIFKKVDLVISTDTSILHLAGTMDINAIGLLSFGCDWRWSKDKTTNWYPKIKLLRQKHFGDWSNVIDELENCINVIHIIK